MTLPRWSLEEVLHQAMMVEAMDRFVKYINPVSYTSFFFIDLAALSLCFILFMVR